MKNRRTRSVSELNALIHELIFCEKTFYPESIKNDNGDASISKTLCNTKGVNNSINLKNEGVRAYKTCLNVPLSSCFLILMKLKEFHVTQNEAPKMVKISTSTNNLSRNFMEDVRYKFSICGGTLLKLLHLDIIFT